MTDLDPRTPPLEGIYQSDRHSVGNIFYNHILLFVGNIFYYLLEIYFVITLPSLSQSLQYLRCSVSLWLAVENSFNDDENYQFDDDDDA